MKRMTFSFFAILLTISVFSQDTNSVKSYFRDNFVFGAGYWVYQDTVNNDQDSISLVNCMHNYVSPNPGWPDYQEYFLMDYYSHSYDYSYNEYIITHYWKRNGGGQYGELGQPIMHIGQYDNIPEVGNGFNGYEIMDIFDSLVVNGNVFNDVVWSHIYEDQQYQYEFSYDTELYFAQDVGIIRKVYLDSLGINHVWDLVNWQTDIYTDVNEDLLLNEKVIIYPNPTNGKITVKAKGMERVELRDIQGKTIYISKGKCDKCYIDIKDNSQGVYFIKVITNKGIVIEKIVIE